MIELKRRSMVMTEDEKEATAYEGGHALVSFNMPSPTNS